MLQRVLGTMRPNAYHGGLFKPPYFEGWYVKLVDRAAEERLALILGISRSSRGDDDHAFIQVFDGLRGQAGHLRFGVEEFSASASRMDVSLGRCHLTDRTYSLDVDGEDGRLEGRIVFDRFWRWPVTPWAPGAMGWYAWMPFMECYHGVVSMDHGVAGQLRWNDRDYDFDGGRGYLEKDWGKAFPSSWIWMQTNHFGQSGVSLMGSIARIPWIGRDFPGFLAAFLHDDRLYRFAVYTGAKTELLRANDEQVHWVLRDRRHQLEIRAHRGESTALKGPSFEGMQRTVNESLKARIEVQLSRRGWRGGLRYEGSSEPAGLEVHGSLEELGAQPG